MISGALFALTGVDVGTSFASIAWRLALLGLGIGTVLTPMTATAVASVPYQQAGMAAAKATTRSARSAARSARPSSAPCSPRRRSTPCPATSPTPG